MGRVIDISELGSVRDAARQRGKRLVLTNGHFDLLHLGHVRYLQEARKLGDLLVVGINDDQTTRARKGPRRPIIPQDQRAELVASLNCVDFAVIFHDETAADLVRELKPECYVKGGDYRADPAGEGSPLPEAEIVTGYGGEVRIIPLVPGQSTSAIEARIIDLWRQNSEASQEVDPTVRPESTHDPGQGR